jgi:surface carbohydrate biosynthesis protein (TIGR04326 family)
MIRIKISNKVWYWGSLNDCDNCYSLSQYVESNGYSIRKKYLAFIHEIGQKSIGGSRIVEHLEITKGFSFWWMTLLAEKSLLKSPAIQDCLKLYALAEILEKEATSAIDLYDVSNKQIKESILIICKNLSIEVNIHSQQDNDKKVFFISKFGNWLFQKTPHIIKGTAWIVRYVFRHWQLRNISKVSWFSSDKTVFFFSYFINLDSKYVSKGKFYSHQWESLPDLFHKLGYRSNWMHHFLLCKQIPDARIGADLIKRFNTDSGRSSLHSFLDSYVSIRVVARATVTWLRLIMVSIWLHKIKSFFLDKKSVVSLWPILKDDWYKSTRGVVAFQNALWVELLNQALSEMPKQNIGLYLSEGQGWERAFIYSWRKHNHGKLIAVVHSAVRFWDLRYFNDSRTILEEDYLAMPKPYKIAVNGPVAQQTLIKANYPAVNFIKVEAVRYLNFENISKLNNIKHSANNRYRLLVLGGGIPSNSTQEMMNVLESESKFILENFSVVVKAHPDYLITQDNYYNLKFELTTDPLDEILYKFDIIIGSHQSAAHLDAYLAGFPVIIYLPDGDLNLSPLRGIHKIPIVNNRKTLIGALRSIHNEREGPKDCFFWLDKNLIKWRKAIKQITKN